MEIASYSALGEAAVSHFLLPDVFATVHNSSYFWQQLVI